MFDDLFSPSPGQVDLTCNTSQIFAPKYRRYPFAENYPSISETSGFSLGYMRVGYPLISVLMFCFLYFFEQFKVPSATSAIITNGEC